MQIRVVVSGEPLDFGVVLDDAQVLYIRWVLTLAAYPYGVPLKQDYSQLIRALQKGIK